MEIEKRYRSYGIALGIDLGIEKRYRTFRYIQIYIYTELTNEFLFEIYFGNYTDLLENFVYSK